MSLKFLAILAGLAMPFAAAAETNRHGDLIIHYGPKPPTAAQKRADPDLVRYPGLTPREPGFRAPTYLEQIEQLRDKSRDSTITIR